WSALQHDDRRAGFARCERRAQSCVTSTDHDDVCFERAVSHVLHPTAVWFGDVGWCGFESFWGLRVGGWRVGEFGGWRVWGWRIGDWRVGELGEFGAPLLKGACPSNWSGQPEGDIKSIMMGIRAVGLWGPSGFQ